MENSSRKRNLSFSFNVDLNSIDSDGSTDSDTTGLQIDVSEADNHDENSDINNDILDDTTYLKKIEETLQRQLDAKAAKTNLTATNVKTMLKHVISHEHIKAMIQNCPSKDDIIFEPKLTRAKAKELAMSQPEILWPITPEKNTTSEVQVLIEGEFSEDSSDEEYDPNKDMQTDDEKDVENSVGSDADSQPSTPATPQDSLVVEEPQTLAIQYDDEGIFKVPKSVPRAPTEEESIGHRTRSKLCLKETPLEEIEQAFVPPDITSDMYDCDWDPGQDYLDFLLTLQSTRLPPKEVNINEDDTEADPEYNILEDEELNFFDKEELRQDKAVKVSKKELRNLIDELGEHGDRSVREERNRQQHLQQQKSTKKKKTPDTSFTTAANTSGNPMIDLLPVLAEPEFPELVNPNQRYLLSIQLSQHVQLMAQQFVMTYKHPKWHSLSKVYKNNLNSLCLLGENTDSKFSVENLDDALKLVSDWETKLDDPEFSQEYTDYLEEEMKLEENDRLLKRVYTPQFHYELIKLMANSKALMHSQLLPIMPPRTTVNEKLKLSYTKSEESLMAIGLEQFIPYVKSQNKKFNKECHIFADAAKEIQKYLLPIRDVHGLVVHIKKQKCSKKWNAIKHYFMTETAPRVTHRLLSTYLMIPPKNQPIEFLPKVWQTFIRDLKKDKLEELVTISNICDKNKSIDCESEIDTYLTSPNNISIHETHPLRNPVVNVLRHMPSLMTPQKNDSTDSPPKSSNNERTRILEQQGTETESETDVETSAPSSASKEGQGDNVIKAKIIQSRANETESDAESAESQRAGETDEESRPTRLRMTTPRLARMKSAQNMKLMTQTSSSKASTSSSNVEENKEDNYDNNDDSSSTVKGDNEDEIAELMLASTTIKKNTTNRKKSKQARELENLKRLAEAENNIDENERATRFAASFLQKVHERLESKDPELFKTVLKSFLDYDEKRENSNQAENDKCSSNEGTSSIAKQDLPEESNILDKDKLTVELYKETCERLQEYPDLCADFLLFLTPHQAALVDKSVDHTMMLKMKEFINVTQMYFAKQPARQAKILQTMMQMESDPSITLEKVHMSMGTILKGHPLILDLFLQTLPSGKPPDCLFASHLFETLPCPVGPHDKMKAYDPDAPELYENIELPASTLQEDPYGGDSCKCDCHNVCEDNKLKSTNEHCASCGTRFLNGRIYLQTSEGLRPAKITFPGAEEEKLENISRVSLKTTKRSLPSPPARKRRKTTKRDSISEEPSSVKSCQSTKASPLKDDDSDRSKPKKNMRSPVKSTDPNKLNKMQSVSVKSKREKKSEKKDVRSEQKIDDDHNEFCASSDQKEFEEADNKLGEMSTDSHEDESMTSPEKMNNLPTSTEKTDVSSDSDCSINLELETLDTNVEWTMQDDKILLEHVQKDYSDKTFSAVSPLLKRTIEQVKERCEYLLSLIEKMS